MDAIFKALNDPARRGILDALREKDGQTLSELEARFEMTRFGVMKHLKVLEDAHLVTTRRAGRFKHHYLNALPLQEVIDRWIEPLLAKHAARAVLDLKAKMERQMSKPDFVMHTFIRCTQDALWDALTDPDAASHYHFLAGRAEMKDGVTTHYFEDGRPMLVSREVEVEPKSRIVTTFEPQWEEGAKPSRVVYMIQPEGDHCRLTLEHWGLTFPAEGNGIVDGWSRWAAGLKSWLETGQDVHFREPADETA
jgi:DNA-binding transcriptional ArsR family regulator/uncharacterized protein YndB with AHSA1/START domain